MLGIDTNVLVRFLVRDDPKQFERARRLIKREVGSRETVPISLLVLLETEWVLRSRYSMAKAEIVAALSALLDAVEYDSLFSFKYSPRPNTAALAMGDKVPEEEKTRRLMVVQERQRAIQEMIVAENKEARVKALDKLLPFQRRDFIGIFKAMDGLPVTIRLIDPPLHEFVPHERAKQEELAKELKLDVEKVARRVEQLHEANPMLGHRGCRLCITYPEILEMQVRAIIEAAIECQKGGVKVLPEIMIPLTLDRKEMSILEQATRRVTDDLIKKAGIKLPYLVGTMIELPRAALLADEIAEVSDFFSFGTNDLTQTTMGLSRDDAGRFLPDYVDEKKAGVFTADPFQSLDIKGVGMLMRWGIERGRKTRAKLKVGICGEHGGDADSVKFCHAIGMDYVSASPFRVPISRLAAAQAVIEDKAAAKSKRK